MATDQTEPRNNLILIYTVLTAVALLILGPLFLAYFKDYVEEQIQKVVLSQPADQYEETRSKALADLQNGRMPIDQAVQAIARQGRDASPLIEPSQSDDVAAVEGWGESKNEAAAEAARQAVERRRAAEEAARQAAAAEAAEAAEGEGDAAEDGGAPGERAPASP